MSMIESRSLAKDRRLSPRRQQRCRPLPAAGNLGKAAVDEDMVPKLRRRDADEAHFYAHPLTEREVAAADALGPGRHGVDIEVARLGKRFPRQKLVDERRHAVRKE